MQLGSRALQKQDHMLIPSNLRRRVRPLPAVPVATAPLELDPSCAYAGLLHFSHFAGNVKFVGGINKPKLVQVRAVANARWRVLFSRLRILIRITGCKNRAANLVRVSFSQFFQ